MSLNLHQEPSRQLKLSDEPKFPYEIRTVKLGSRRIVFAVVFFGPGLVLLFIQGLFSVLECFKLTKRFGFESVTTVECKQKKLMH